MLAVPELVGRLGECAAQQTVSWGKLWNTASPQSSRLLCQGGLAKDYSCLFCTIFWPKSLFPSIPCCCQTQSLDMSCASWRKWYLGVSTTPQPKYLFYQKKAMPKPMPIMPMSQKNSWTQTSQLWRFLKTCTKCKCEDQASNKFSVPREMEMGWE